MEEPGRSMWLVGRYPDWWAWAARLPKGFQASVAVCATLHGGLTQRASLTVAGAVQVGTVKKCALIPV